MAKITELVKGPFTVGVETFPSVTLMIGQSTPNQGFKIWVKCSKAFKQSTDKKQLRISVVVSIGDNPVDLFGSVLDQDGHEFDYGKGSDKKTAWKPGTEPKRADGTIPFDFTALGTLVLKADEKHYVATFNKFNYSSKAGDADIKVTLSYDGESQGTFQITKKEPPPGTPVVVLFNVDPYPAWPNKEAKLSWKVVGLDTKTQHLNLIERVPNATPEKVNADSEKESEDVTNRTMGTGNVTYDLQLVTKDGATPVKRTLASLEVQVHTPGFLPRTNRPHPGR